MKNVIMLLLFALFLFVGCYDVDSDVKYNPSVNNVSTVSKVVDSNNVINTSYVKNEVPAILELNEYMIVYDGVLDSQFPSFDIVSIMYKKGNYARSDTITSISDVSVFILDDEMYICDNDICQQAEDVDPSLEIETNNYTRYLYSDNMLGYDVDCYSYDTNKEAYTVQCFNAQGLMVYSLVTYDELNYSLELKMQNYSLNVDDSVFEVPKN